MKPLRALWAAVAVAVGTMAVPAANAVPPLPQGYTITDLYKSCTPEEAHEKGYPAWHYGETARRYLNDGVLQFKNNTDQEVKYSATVESSTNHEIKSNAVTKAAPPGWNTTAKADIGLKLSNGWVEGETFGPITLAPGESFRVEYGVVEKDFIAMFVSCQNGFLQNLGGADVIRGTAPTERYAFAYVIKPDGSVSDVAMEIPSRSQGANSQPVDGEYTTISGPSIEQVADPTVDHKVEPAEELQASDDWGQEGERCFDRRFYPYDIEAVAPTVEKPGYSQDFLNWSDGDYTFAPITDHVVGAQFHGAVMWNTNQGRVPSGWLESVGAVYRAYMPVGTALKSVDLGPGDRVRVEYGTKLMRINYREITCGNDGRYSRVVAHPQAFAPAGFWATATVTSPDGTETVFDVTPDDWADLPVITQSNR